MLSINKIFAATPGQEMTEREMTSIARTIAEAGVQLAGWSRMGTTAQLMMINFRDEEQRTRIARAIEDAGYVACNTKDEYLDALADA